MMSNFLTELRADAHLRELYRNPRELTFLTDGLPALSGHLSWSDIALLKFGDLLISAGTHLKNSARPQAILSQEIL